MDLQRLQALLGAAHSPAVPPQQRQAAEAELQSLARSPAALNWSLAALAAPQQLDAAARFFACAVVDEAAHYRWARLLPPQQAAVRAALWAGAADPGAPHFQRAKLAATLAHTAAIDGPEAWLDFVPALQAALGDPARREPALDLLGATLDTLHALSQATAAGLRGKVPSATLPVVQQRYRDLQPLALATLCSLLLQLRDGLATALQTPGAAGAAGAASLAAKALRTLRAALADAARLPEQQGVTAAALAALLFDFVAAARLAPPGGEADEAAAAAASAALGCAADLCAKYLGGEEATRAMLAVLLPQLQDACALVGERWGRQRGDCQADDPLLTALVRLLAQFFTTQLSNVEAVPQLGAQVPPLLGQLLALSTARRSPADLLLFLEAWHAVLDHVSGFEGALWECEGDAEAERRVAAVVASFKEPVLAVSDLVLSTLCLGASAGAPPPPFTVDALSAAPGSGAALEDWLASVAAGGDGADGEAEGAAAEAAAAGEDEDEADELLVPGVAPGARPFHADSERDVYVRHCESFLGQAIGSFAVSLVPRLLLRLQACSVAFAAACDAAAAVATAPQQQQYAAAAAAAALDAQAPAFRAMDLCLQLLLRCGPHFPTRGAADAPAPLAADGDVPVSGAHAVQSLRGLLQLAAVWLRAVQALAAATQQAGAPATPAHAATGAGAGLQALLLAGARVYKAAGSLTATWLSQLVMGLVQQSADPDAAAAAQELVLGTLGGGAALLAGLASPALHGWRPLLHRAAVWAAEGLVALSSIALSSALRPPPALLDAVWRSEPAQALRGVHEASLAHPGLLPLRAARALGLCLSDLALRSWPSQPAAQFDGDARGAAFASVAAPVVQLLQGAAAAAPAQAAAGDAAAAVRLAAAVATSVVQSYAGSPKPLRAIVSGALAAPLLPAAVALLQAGGGGALQGGRAAGALLRLVTACLEVLPTELGGGGVEQLLAALVHAFAASGADPTFEADLVLARLLVLVLSQGGAARHRALVQPALHYLLGLWQRAGAAAGAGAGADADPSHVRAVALAAMLSLLRYKWQALMGAAKPVVAAAAGGTPGASAGAHPLAASLQASAAAAQQQQGGQGQQGGCGSAAVEQVLALLLQFLAGGRAAVLAAADVRRVLEELYELQLATRLYALPLAAPLRPALGEALLGLLASRLYGAAAADLTDSLYALAASNWSEFHLQVLPRFVEQRLGGLGASERGALLAAFDGADLAAHAFEARLLRFVNDAAYYERASQHAAC